ncbi:hypothetical protein L2W58_08115 [Dethiosulfovibrio sp. F2B]|uniref:hypothetical protein n=1 Tax=Dethiosulfovibrio faecalis TaxID=2720018 RepID=UPI001F266446|nr:hypothetical protein [Dethiosulfovibrio faecalis]MCF4151766.1 hypothetical protein [Dethiosulfovibrio faecalis]
MDKESYRQPHDRCLSNTKEECLPTCEHAKFHEPKGCKIKDATKWECDNDYETESSIISQEPSLGVSSEVKEEEENRKKEDKRLKEKQDQEGAQYQATIQQSISDDLVKKKKKTVEERNEEEEEESQKKQKDGLDDANLPERDEGPYL